MDLVIPDKHLRKYLDTKATPAELAKYLSLCGPSIERTKKYKDGDSLYQIEITTNRTDSASIYGVAREAGAILPRFGISAKLKSLDTNKILSKYTLRKSVNYLDVVLDKKLCPRFTAVLIENVTVKESPGEIKDLLEKTNLRPINNIVDISNYIMHLIGQPVHTFDYDKIESGRMILRESKKNETVKTLDGKEFELDAGNIVIQGASGDLIDLCGIMGGENSKVDENTKNILLFVQNYNKHYIRKTSMNLGIRSEAAVLFEKGLDSENVLNGIALGIKLIEKTSNGKPRKDILDIYPNPYKGKVVKTDLITLNKIIGIEIPKQDITKYLISLGFKVIWEKDNLEVSVPSFRSEDIDIPEDIAEEVARIYGYHNLPPVLMAGDLPNKVSNADEFAFENKVKQTLKALSGIEVYNLSLTENGDIKLKNPLGADTEYLRSNLQNSLVANINYNTQEKGYIHLFEVANVYIPRKNDLPEERLVLSGIVKESTYRKDKGLVQTLLNELNIDYKEVPEDGKNFKPNQRIAIYSGKILIGEYGNLENSLFEDNNSCFYYSFEMKKLMTAKKIERKYQEINKFPPQVEDITLTVPERTYIGVIIEEIYKVSEFIKAVTLTDVYENKNTFNIKYQSGEKTLEDKEVEEIRNKVMNILSSKFGIKVG
jgi:phenylalanyl-tRNA synthetase beta chain